MLNASDLSESYETILKKLNSNQLKEAKQITIAYLTRPDPIVDFNSKLSTASWNCLKLLNEILSLPCAVDVIESSKHIQTVPKSDDASSVSKEDSITFNQYTLHKFTSMLYHSMARACLEPGTTSPSWIIEHFLIFLDAMLTFMAMPEGLARRCLKWVSPMELAATLIENFHPAYFEKLLWRVDGTLRWHVSSHTSEAVVYTEYTQDLYQNGKEDQDDDVLGVDGYGAGRVDVVDSHLEYGLVDDRQLEIALNLAKSFGCAPFSYQTAHHLLRVMDQLDRIKKRLNDRDMEEITLAAEHLLSDEIDEQDLKASSRWFRQAGSLQNREAMLKKGFAQYKLDQEKVSPNYKMDSVLVANYLKVKIKKIPLGLIPEDIQNFIVELFTEVENTTDVVLDKRVCDIIGGLLMLNPQRQQILTLLGKLARRLFQECTKDPIQPMALARIIKVTNDNEATALLAGSTLLRTKSEVNGSPQPTGSVGSLIESSSETFRRNAGGSEKSKSDDALNEANLAKAAASKINNAYDRWHRVWGVILANMEQFIPSITEGTSQEPIDISVYRRLNQD